MTPLVAVIMGSQSDWEVMSHAAETLARLNIPHEAKVLSAHRAPDLLSDYLQAAESRGLEVIIAGAGMAAHLAGVTASATHLPVLGVPLQSGSLGGLDALLSTAQMPAGVPVATFAIGKAGAINAALFAACILAQRHPEYGDALRKHRQAQRDQLLADSSLPPKA